MLTADPLSNSVIEELSIFLTDDSCPGVKAEPVSDGEVVQLSTGDIGGLLVFCRR